MNWVVEAISNLPGYSVEIPNMAFGMKMKEKYSGSQAIGWAHSSWTCRSRYHGRKVRLIAQTVLRLIGLVYVIIPSLILLACIFKQYLLTSCQLQFWAWGLSWVKPFLCQHEASTVWKRLVGKLVHESCALGNAWVPPGYSYGFLLSHPSIFWYQSTDIRVYTLLFNLCYFQSFCFCKSGERFYSKMNPMFMCC